MRKLILSLAVLAAACGGPGNSVTGTVAGKSLVAADAVSLVGVSGGQGGVVVLISEQAQACVEWAGARFKQNKPLLMLTIGKKGAIPPPGKYPISTTLGADTTAAAAWFVTDAKCQTGNPVPATAGTITLDRSAAEGAAGSFDVTIDGSNVKGTFDAKLCLFASRVLRPDSDATCSP